MNKKQKTDGDAPDVQPDPLNVTIGPAHLVTVLKQKYPQVFDACLGFASAAAQEQQARAVLTERDKEIEELKAKLSGKCAVKDAEQIISDGAAE